MENILRAFYRNASFNIEALLSGCVQLNPGGDWATRQQDQQIHQRFASEADFDHLECREFDFCSDFIREDARTRAGKKMGVMTMLDSMLNEFLEEAAVTRRVLERIPKSRLWWKPHLKSMSLGQLALHIATMPGELAGIIRLGGFDASQGASERLTPLTPTSLEEIHAEFERSLLRVEECFRGMTEETAHGDWRLMSGKKEIFVRPRIKVLRSVMLNHWYHHRGQLTVYLRLLDLPLPAVYGASADENPFA